MRTAALIGVSLGLIVCCGVLTLLWFGVAGILWIDGTNLTNIVWPSSLMLIGGWRTTLNGILTTLVSVVLNCATYAIIAVLLWTGVVGTRHLWK